MKKIITIGFLEIILFQIYCNDTYKFILSEISGKKITDNNIFILVSMNIIRII